MQHLQEHALKKCHRKRDSVHIYSNTEGIVLKLRRQSPTETDLLSPSFKVAVELSDDDVIGIIREPLTVVSLRKKVEKK